MTPTQRRSNPKGYWKDWKNAKREINKAIDENKGEFPNVKRLKEMGRGDLIYAIRIHGGIPAVRKKIGYNEKMQIKLAKELEKIVMKIRMPS